MKTPAGFFDLQVNGYAGVDFNADDLSAEDFDAACRRLAADGVGSCLATVITDSLDAMTRRIGALARLREGSSMGRQVVAGIHVEGPFISPLTGYVGAHPAAAVRPADPATAERLIEAGQGQVRLVTLAPEHDAGAATTRYLCDHGVTVSAGHCNPTLDELRRAIDAGLSMFTHLGNGCPRLLDRHDNVVQRALACVDDLWLCFIADGVHVPYVALRNYLRIAGRERAIVVTDAISAAGMGPGRYRLGGQEVVVDERLATWSADGSHLMGSAMTMPAAIANLRRELGLSEADARRLTCENPRQAVPSA
ncbi:MAG: N-acetylglucosamine-6-phosphate deacetylase [Pirellulales bacterium]|nr:N-acetylglucosamine-6-phosphate deacetylase [Pirellulales bacterium]